MTINQLVELAKRVHDAEGWQLGARSTRETRNAFNERVIGIAHWGHPKFNPTPDPQWHCKDPDGPAPGGRPPSDDVAVSMPSRNFWDFIPGAGADGYRFEAHAEGPLPMEQFVFVPAKPAGWGGVEPVVPLPAYPGYPQNEADIDGAGVALFADFAQANQSPNPQMFRFAFRVAFDWLTKSEPSLAASVTKHRRDWRGLLGL